LRRKFRTTSRSPRNDVPEKRAVVISRRLERLDESEKRAITAAPVTRRSFSFQLLAAIRHRRVDDGAQAARKA